MRLDFDPGTSGTCTGSQDQVTLRFANARHIMGLSLIVPVPLLELAVMKCVCYKSSTEI
jgi:hypothetical protein